MQKKRKDFFEVFTLSEVLNKFLSSKAVQPMLNRTFEQTMKLKSKLDIVMPLVLGILNLPSVTDIKRLNTEVTKLNSKLEELSQKLTVKHKAKKKAVKKPKSPAVKPKKEISNNTQSPL